MGNVTKLTFRFIIYGFTIRYFKS